MKQIIKRNGLKENFDFEKIKIAVGKAIGSQDINEWLSTDGNYIGKVLLSDLKNAVNNLFEDLKDNVTVEDIQDIVERIMMVNGCYDAAKRYILYREKHSKTRDIVDSHISFIEKYKNENVVANTTVDANANVRSRSVANMNAEIKKEENILVNRGIVMKKLRELFPDFDAKQYARDLECRLIYKHDESTSNSGPTLPYCCSSSMYQFLLNGIKDLGGLSAAPKNIDSFCGMFCNLVFTEAGQFLGATAFPETLLYFTYFAKKEWGDDFYLNPDKVISINSSREKTIRSQIHQYWQQIIYTINQNSANRGLQAASKF